MTSRNDITGDKIQTKPTTKEYADNWDRIFDKELTIENKALLDAWLNERRQMMRDVVSIKGSPPLGATYGDGELIQRPVNIAWKDTVSGEVFTIKYKEIKND